MVKYIDREEAIKDLIISDEYFMQPTHETINKAISDIKKMEKIEQIIKDADNLKIPWTRDALLVLVNDISKVIESED